MCTLRQKEKDLDKRIEEFIFEKKNKDNRDIYWKEWDESQDPGKEYLKKFEDNLKEDYCYTPIYDGTFNAELYEKNKEEGNYSVLIIGKEPHDRSGDSECYRDTDFKYGGNPWNISQRVLYGILNKKFDYTKTKINNFNDLKKAAFVNIQKCRAGSETNNRKLRDWYQSSGFKDIFEDQLRLLDPNIIICLNTWEIIHESIYNTFSIDKKKSKIYNVFAKKQWEDKEDSSYGDSATTVAFFNFKKICINCDHFSFRFLKNEAWIQGILTAVRDWRRFYIKMKFISFFTSLCEVKDSC